MSIRDRIRNLKKAGDVESVRSCNPMESIADSADPKQRHYESILIGNAHSDIERNTRNRWDRLL